MAAYFHDEKLLREWNRSHDEFICPHIFYLLFFFLKDAEQIGTIENHLCLLKKSNSCWEIRIIFNGIWLLVLSPLKIILLFEVTREDFNPSSH